MYPEYFGKAEEVSVKFNVEIASLRSAQYPCSTKLTLNEIVHLLWEYPVNLRLGFVMTKTGILTIIKVAILCHSISWNTRPQHKLEYNITT